MQWRFIIRLLVAYHQNTNTNNNNNNTRYKMSEQTKNWLLFTIE